MEEKKMIKLPESELEIMRAIWALNGMGEKFVSAGLIMKRYPEITRLKLTTVLTLITRLQKKGYIVSEKLGRSNCYTPLISLVDYRKFASADFLEKVYGDDRVTLIRDILENADLSEDERSKILALVNTAE